MKSYEMRRRFGGLGWARASLAVALLSLVVAGCGETDPGVIGPSGVDGALSPEGQRQAYVDGVGRALDQLGTATQGPAFAAAVDKGNRRQLQAASIAWRQGGEQLKTLDPPKDAVAAHTALIKAVEQLDTWNGRVTAAAPNKAMTRKLARQAAGSPASQLFEQSVCDLVDLGYDVVDPGACSPLQDASPVG